MNMQGQILDCSIVKVNARNFVLIKMDNKGPMFPCPMRQWSLSGSAGGKVYTFTFSAVASEATKWEPVFQQTLQSIKLDGGPMGWFLELPQAMKWGVVGGLIGGLVGTIRWLVRKSKKTPPAGQSPQAPPPIPPGSGF